MSALQHCMEPPSGGNVFDINYRLLTADILPHRATWGSRKQLVIKTFLTISASRHNWWQKRSSKSVAFSSLSIGISRRSVLVSKGDRGRVADREMSNNSENATIHPEFSAAEPQGRRQAMILRELLSAFYIVGIVGSFLALLHLHQNRNFKNSKQVFMLK